MNLVDEYGILSSKYSKFRCAIIEIDYTKIKSLYLTASHPSGFNETYTSISVWKTSESFGENTFVDRVRDRRMDSEKGFLYPGKEYGTMPNRVYGFYPAYGYSVGYKMNPNVTENHKFSDLVEDTVPKVLNQSKYVFVKEFEDINCFERRIDLNLDLGEGYSSKILLVISGGIGPFSVSLVNTDDQNADSSVTIGMDPNGIDLTTTHYIRYYNNNHIDWRAPATGEPHDDTHYYANDIFDETLGYGVLTPVTNGFRLQTKEDLEQITKPNLNVFPDGTINPYNTIVEPPSGDPDGVIVANALDTNYNCCVVVVKASYEDPDGKKYPNSIYISSKMKGKAGLYAIFELTDGNGGNGVWDVDSGQKPQNLRELKDPTDFGKYINGYTTLNAKKITMPYSKTQDRLMLVVIASYGESPKVWLHDPKQAEKMQYLTIASVNNGDPKLRADETNRFTSALEYGTIDNQNGSKSNVVDYTRLRTAEPLTIPSDGSYMLYFSNAASNQTPTEISADIYIYGKIDGYIMHTGFYGCEPYVFLPYLYEGYELNVVFKKTPVGSIDNLEMSINDVYEPMLWREDNATIMLFTQGELTAVTDPVTQEVSIIPDPSVLNVISTADYYTTALESCTLKVTYQIDSATMPTTYTTEEDGETINYPINSWTLYVSYWKQTPTIETDANQVKTVVYKSYTADPVTHSGSTFTIASENNTRYKFYVSCDIDYYDRNGVLQSVSNVDIAPNLLRTFSVVAYTDDRKAYVPPNDSFSKYGYIEKRIEFDDLDSSSELKERAVKYLAQSQFDEMVLKVKALDMTMLNQDAYDNLEIADAVRAVSPPHGLYRDFPIAELSIPFDKPDNSTFELGYDNKSKLSDIINGG